MNEIKQIKSFPLSVTLMLATNLALIACEGIPIGTFDNTHDEKLIIDGNKVECKLFNAENSTLCLHAKNNKDGAKFFLEKNEITGFSYDWGYDYELEVEVEKLIDPPQDAPDKKYTFKKQTKKEPASTVQTFEISVSEGSLTTLIKKVPTKTNTYKIFEDKEIECLPDICANLDQFIATDNAVLLELKHQIPATKPLDLVKIKCNAPKDKFLRDCLEQ